MIILNCKDIQTLFSEYYDDYLPAEISRTAFEAHLNECAACAAEYKKYAQLLSDVQRLPEPQMPWGFHQRLMTYVETRTVKKKWSFFRSVPQWGAVAASLVAIFMWGLVAFAPTETNDHMGYIPIAPISSEGFVPIVPAMEELPPTARVFEDPWEYDLPQYDDYQEIAPYNAHIPDVDHEDWLRRRGIVLAIAVTLAALCLWGVAAFTRRTRKGLN